MARVKRSERYVAFLDILGFRELLADEKFDQKIEMFIQTLWKRVDFDARRHPYLKYLAVSDSIIIAAEEGRSPNLLWKISQVQNSLLEIGFATRGGIAFGEVYAEFEADDIRNIFGKAYVDAYEIEQSLAIYPRVVIDIKLQKKMQSEFPGATKYPFQDFLLNDFDGCLFANQFGRDEVHMKSGSKKLINEALSHRSDYTKKIARGLKTSSPKSRMKWQWLSAQLNERLNV